MAQLTYVSRIDASLVHDWIYTDFTRDNNWNVWDLSAIVPENAVAVQLLWYMKRTAAARTWYLRAVGSTATYANWLLLGGAANLGVTMTPLVPLSADRTIEYKIDNLNWNDGSLNVLGWFLYE